MHKTTSRLVQMLSEKMLSDCKENEYMYQMYMRAERSMLINLIDIILINKLVLTVNAVFVNRVNSCMATLLILRVPCTMYHLFLRIRTTITFMPCYKT